MAWRLEEIARAADFAGLLAWRQFRPIGRYFMGPVRGLPVALPIISDAILVGGSLAVSDAPQWPQQYLIPPYSRAAATAFSRLAPALARVNAPSSRARSPR